MRALAVVIALAAAGCGGDEPPMCVTVDATCTDFLYEPTFDNVYTMTIKQSCGTDNVSCHTAGGAANMSLADESTAYASLLAGRVEAGNPACSEMIVRITSVGESYQMPLGPASSALSAEEQCSLIHWVEVGAPAGSGSGS